jgi:DNA-binding transcriptional ArsR family regulator
MAAEVREVTLAGKARATVSAIVELQFLLFVVRNSSKKYDSEPMKQLFAAQHPGLVTRVKEFWEGETWGDPDCEEWGELLVLADAGGALLSEDPADFFDRLDGIAAAGVPLPPLETEEPATREAVKKRLDALAASPSRRAECTALLRDCWAVLQGPWEAGGRERAAQAAARINTALETAARLAQVLPSTHVALREQFEPLISRELERRRVTFVPSGLTGVAASIYALPSTLLVSSGYGHGELAKHWREVGERAASKLKVLGDPTRLAILNRLLHGPMSITDLSRYFDLSQPTVSVHVKLLREAGLLESERSGQHTLYRAWPDQVTGYIEEATRMLLEDSTRRPRS